MLLTRDGPACEHLLHFCQCTSCFLVRRLARVHALNARERILQLLRRTGNKSHVTEGVNALHAIRVGRVDTPCPERGGWVGLELRVLVNMMSHAESAGDSLSLSRREGRREGGKEGGGGARERESDRNREVGQQAEAEEPGN